MLHHLSLGTTHMGRAVAFHDAVPRPLGCARVWSDLRPGETGQAVIDFHAAAQVACGQDNGPPGLRADDGDAYVAAFAIDPDGHRLEAVCNGHVLLGKRKSAHGAGTWAAPGRHAGIR